MRTRTALAASGSAFLFVCGGGVAHADGAVPGAVPAGLPGLLASALPTALPGAAPTAVPTAPPAALPEPGTAFSVREDGDMVMECDGVVHRIEVHGTGDLRVGDKLAGVQPTFAVSTDTEELTGSEADLGTVTVTAKGPVSGEFVAASAGQPFPAAESLAQDVTVTVEHSPCRGGQPAVYASKAGFSLLNTDLMAFPQRNAVYQLTDPVELADVADPSAAPFTLTGFVVTVDRVW